MKMLENVKAARKDELTGDQGELMIEWVQKYCKYGF